MATLGVLDILISVKDDNVQSQLNKSEKTVKNWGNKISAWTVAKGQMIGRFAETAIKSTARVMKQTVGDVVKSFGTYEQLEQGAQLMFGKGFDFIIDKAENAYEKVQISKNEYLEQANAYATGLKNSLNGDGEAAAELADRIITAQADVVAATGASREGVENAFKGLLRGNYMMLDNLQIGIKGTKEGMKDVIDRVNEWNKANGKATKYQMDNLADMNNALIDYIKMVGMAGYAQQEGADTLQGSIASTKAAWKDLITNIGRGKDIKKSVENFGKAAKKAFANLRPVIRNAVSGIFATVKELMPEIGGLFEDLKTDLKESDVPILRVLGEGLDKVQLAWKGLNALIEDFPGTVEKLKQSDDPFAKFLGGGLDTAKKTLDWIVEKSGSAENAIKNLALAFAGIKIAPGVMSFLSKLLQIAANKKILSLFGGGGAGAGAGAAGAAGATKAASLLKYGKAFAGATAFFATLFDTEGNVPFAGSRDREHNTQFWNADGSITPAGRQAGYTENDFEVKEGAAYTQWRHNKTLDNLKNLLQYKDYNADTLGFVEELNGRDMKNFGDWVTNFQKRYNDWYWYDKNDPKLEAAVESMDQAMFERLDSFMEHFGTADGKTTAVEAESLFSDLQAHLEEQLAKSKNKVQVEPEVDIGKLRKDLQGASLSVPVTPQLVVGGGIFGKFFGHAKGSWDVPYDNYPALLHRGEMVKTASQARRERNEETAGGVNLPAVIARSVKESMKNVNFLLNGDKVADLSYKRTKKNINAQSQSRIRAYGGA